MKKVPLKCVYVCMYLFVCCDLNRIRNVNVYECNGHDRNMSGCDKTNDNVR